MLPIKKNPILFNKIYRYLQNQSYRRKFQYFSAIESIVNKVSSRMFSQIYFVAPSKQLETPKKDISTKLENVFWKASK